MKNLQVLALDAFTGLLPARRLLGAGKSVFVRSVCSASVENLLPTKSVEPGPHTVNNHLRVRRRNNVEGRSRGPQQVAQLRRHVLLVPAPLPRGGLPVGDASGRSGRRVRRANLGQVSARLPRTVCIGHLRCDAQNLPHVVAHAGREPAGGRHNRGRLCTRRTQRVASILVNTMSAGARAFTLAEDVAGRRRLAERHHRGRC